MVDDFDWRKREAIHKKNLQYEAIGRLSVFLFLCFPIFERYVFGSLSVRTTFLVDSTFIPPSLSAASYCRVGGF